MYPLFETIRIDDGQPQYLGWHQERVAVSCYAHFGRYPQFRLERVIRVPSRFSGGRVKCRLFYTESDYRSEFEFYYPKRIRSLQLVEAGDLDYSLKYSDRDALKSLFIQRGDCDEVLITKNGRITDTSYTNIVFFDGRRWFTPQHPLLEGTCRNRLVAEKMVFEEDIHVDDLAKYRSFRLINAMLPFEEQESVEIKNIRVHQP